MEGRWVCTILPNEPGDYPAVKGHQQRQPWQATGLVRDAIKTSIGNLRLTHSDRLVASFPHIHALYSNCEEESSTWVTSVGFPINLFICVLFGAGGEPECLVTGNYLLYSLLQTNYHMQMNKYGIGIISGIMHKEITKIKWKWHSVCSRTIFSWKRISH